ncbi:phage tail tube protein [Rheinheimera sp.]|uniref:phage tail tube protein n=1 Tax=Rheinheimera sp. TaxID=1869214 RepID=UPI0027331F3A|nr:phage tail tube protein [Rheinheimera sp.]MDP2715540.1 phage tail tube protein [Rheinheimera sp.]
MAVIGAGTKFKIKIAPAAEFILLPGVRSIGDTGAERPLVETTPLDKLDKEYIAGMKDGDEKDIVCNYEAMDATQKTFRDAARAGTTIEVEIEYPNAVTAAFSLVLLSFRVLNPESEQALQFSTKTKVSGPVTWTDPVTP